MSRATQNLVLLLVGLSTAVMLAKGTYLNYVKPALLPWLIAAAAVLVALGLAAVIRDLRHAPDRHDDDGDDHGDHRHQPWLVWLLLIPIAMVAFVVPPARFRSAPGPRRQRGRPAGGGQHAPATRLSAVACRGGADSLVAGDGDAGGRRLDELTRRPDYHPDRLFAATP
jgi:hypothetical protein